MMRYSDKELDAEIAAYFQDNPGWEHSLDTKKFRQAVRTKMEKLGAGRLVRDRGCIREAIAQILTIYELRKSTKS